MSAHDITTAMRVAVGARLPRLATLIAGAGVCPNSSSLLSHQIKAGKTPSWTTFGLFQDPKRRLMPPALEAVYKLLSGDVSAALVFLLRQSVTWQRAFAMCLWYGILPDQPLTAAILCFRNIVSASTLHNAVRAPLPRPWYERSELHALPKEQLMLHIVDAQFALLHVAAQESLLVGSAPVSLALQLASTWAYGPDPLDALMPWLSTGILIAMGQLKDDFAGDRSLEEMYAQLTLDCAATLLWLGESRWAVYVLCHLPVSYFC